ncbi:MAG: TetR/AcrR family transcriptional regulator [Vagococcus sp.]|uniref:TetR/AcrR family transcriptional regulator n=1 Tax=Vagococcus sp. TaxID=1933889 RepID=UPI002FC5EB51
MEDKQLEILKIATREFAVNGYYKAKTDTIAEEAKVSKGLVFHYFKSKKNLYIETIREAVKTLEATFDESEIPQDSLVELFDYSLKKKFEIEQTHQDQMQLMLEVYSNLDHLPEELNDEIAEFIEKVRNDNYEMVARIVRRLPMKNGVREEDVISLVVSLFNQLEAEAKESVKGQEVKELSFFDKQVSDAKRKISILEDGFLRVNKNFSR